MTVIITAAMSVYDLLIASGRVYVDLPTSSRVRLGGVQDIAVIWFLSVQRVQGIIVGISSYGKRE